MLVYQLKLKDYNILLEPVFISLKGANIYKKKYQNRKIDIIENNVEINNLDYIYRIKTLEEDGYSLIEFLFTSIESAKSYIEKEKLKKAEVVKEYFSSEYSVKDFLIEV